MLRAVMCADGPAVMTIDAELAVGEEPAWSPWRDSALLLLAEARLLTGDLDEAAALLAESAALGAQLGNTDTIVAGGSELAMLLMDSARWEEAAVSLAPAMATIDEYRMDDYVVSGLAFAAAARLALHRGDLDETNRQLTRAMRTRPTCTYVIPWLAVRLRLQLAKVYLALSDATTAHHLMREIDDILLRRPSLGTLTEDVRAFQTVARRQRTEGGERRTATQSRRAQGPAVPPDTSHAARDRRTPVRFAQHRPVAGRIDLSQVRCLIAK